MFEFFHKQPFLMWVLIGLGSILGVLGYINMPRNMYPDVDRPSVTVVTQLPGASALTVTQRVTRPIEQQLYTIPGIRDVQSVNKNEVSIVTAEFKYTKGLARALLDVNNTLTQSRASLPSETGPSSIYATGAFTSPVMTVSLAPKAGSGMTLEQVRLLAENDIRTAFLTQPNVSNVDVFGGYQPSIRIDFDPIKLARFNIDPSTLQGAVSKIDHDYPIGIIEGANHVFSFSIYGERQDADALRALPLSSGLILGDVATVSRSYAEPYSAFHNANGEAIAVAIQRPPEGSVQRTIDSATSILPSLEARFPNVQFNITDTQGPLVEMSNQNMIDALVDAVIFVALVIMLFLANWRAVVTALISIPLVFLLTLAVLWVTGKELNILVMTGIILALGMLVDDAVVVLENIERHLEELKEDVDSAIFGGTREVISPIFIGTIATSVVVAPLMFVGGFPQQVFSHMIFPVIVAVFVSYFLSITLIPRISMYWYREGLPKKSTLEKRLENAYQRYIGQGANFYAYLLRFAFGRKSPGFFHPPILGRLLQPLKGINFKRAILFIFPFLLLAFSFRTVLPLIGREALPPMDTGIVRVHVKFGGNLSVEESADRLKEFEKQLKEDKRLVRWNVVYGSEPGILSVGSGQLTGEATYSLTYVDRLHRAETSWQIEAALREALHKIPGVISADAYDFGATSLSSIKASVDIRLFADDWRLLPDAAEKARAAMMKVPGFTSVSTTWDRDSEEVELQLDDAKLMTFGITPDQVGAQLPMKGMNVASVGRMPSMSGMPVRLYFSAPYRDNPQRLLNLPIRLPDGQQIMLGDVAKLIYLPATAEISTDGIRYSLDIYGFRSTLPVSFLSMGTLEAIGKVLPPGVSAKDFGDFNSSQESTKLMLLGLLMGLLVLFGVLIPAYRSFGLAALSIFILPLSAIGAIWGLLAFGKAMALPAILGIVLLFSIIIKNSILMVDFMLQRSREGRDAYEAATDSIKLRYRPILMTALATIAGMAPIAMQRAIGLERLSPLADAAIGGLLIGTFLSLFYLPMLYVWLGKYKANS